MTTRERWIVYPLLFLALGSSIKNHITKRIDCRTLVANNIEIVDRHARRQAVLRSTSEGGELILSSSPSASTPGRTTLSAGGVRAQNVQISGPNGPPQGVLTTSPNGAVLTLHDQNGRAHTHMEAGGIRAIGIQAVTNIQTPFVNTTTVVASTVRSHRIHILGADKKIQAKLEATTIGVGRLQLFNTNDGQKIGISAPFDPAVSPAKVNGKQPAKKKPVEQKTIETQPQKKKMKKKTEKEASKQAS